MMTIKLVSVDTDNMCNTVEWCMIVVPQPVVDRNGSRPLLLGILRNSVAISWVQCAQITLSYII